MERRKCWSLKGRKGREGNSRTKNIAFDSLHADLNASSPSLFITFHARCNRFCGKGVQLYLDSEHGEHGE